MCSRRAWDGAAGVADREDRPLAIFAAGDANPASRTIIFARVLEQILKNESYVMFFTGDLHVGTIAFDLGIHPSGSALRSSICASSNCERSTELKAICSRPASICERSNRSSIMLVIRNVW